MTNQEIKKALRTKLEKSITQVLKFSANDMTQFTCGDGSTISVDSDDLTIGASVYQTDDNGNLTPAPDDTYTLDDGREITVLDGKINTIGAGTSATGDDTSTTSPDTADTNTTMADDATAPTDAPATANDTTDTSDIGNRVSALEQAVNQIIDLLNNNQTMTEQLMNRVERLSKEPAAEGIKINKTGFNNNKINVNAELQSIRKRKIEMEKSGMVFPS